MSIFTVGCKIANVADRSRSKVIPHLMVDTGSLYTWISAADLQDLGVQPEKRIRAQMANGAVLERESGWVFIMVGQFFCITQVVFALKGDLLLLGATTLEELNVRVDPNAKQLLDAGAGPAAPMAGYTDEEASAFRESFGSQPAVPLAVPQADAEKAAPAAYPRRK